MMQGLSPRGGVRRKHGTNVRVDGQKPSREQETQPTFQTRTSRNDEGQSSADSLRQGRLLCISQVLLVFSKFKNLTPLFYLGKNVIGITIACDVTAADLWSATNSMMHKKERIIRMAELYMRQFGWSVGHPTYMEKFCSCERLISGASFEVNEIALRHLYNTLRLCSRAVIVIVNSKTFISARM